MRWVGLLWWSFVANNRLLNHPFLQAYTRGLRYPQYMFMTYGWFPDLWWEQQDADLNCTADQRNLVLNHTLALLQYDFPEHLNGTAATDTGLVSVLASTTIGHVVAL